MHTLDLPQRPLLTLAAARKILAAAEAEAGAQGIRVTIAVVDDGGHPLHLARMDGIHLGTVEVALAKARSAALFRKPTQVFAEGLGGGGTGLLALPNVLPFAGGVPLIVGDACVGAIGVSGATPALDAAVAAAGAAVLSARGE